MSDRTTLPRPGSTSGAACDSSLQSALHTASTIRNRWQRGVAPNLAQVLQSNPELKNHRTVVLELAHDEYRLRLEAGESLDAAEFSRRFPSLERSLYFYLAVQSLVDNDPDFAALQDATSWPEAGSHFLGFDLLRELGRGAAGRVFLASERALGERPVVLKVALHGGHEADILGRLRHANIVPIHSIQEDASGLTAFCMPYLGQATLAAVLDFMYVEHRPPLRAAAIHDAVREANEDADVPDAPLPDAMLRSGSYVEGVIHLAVQLAEALAHAHAQGIFHRDLKPSNILMAPNGQPLLLDFNLSVDDRHPIWRIGGTLPYMAPEELSILCEPQAHAPHYDLRSDLFSLGVLLYELLTGVLPFGPIVYDRPAEEIADRLRKRQLEGPRPLRQQNHQVDKRLAGLIERCLALTPEQRPESAAVLAAALRKELTLSRRARRWVTAHRRLVLAAAFSAMFMLLAAVTFFMLRPPYPVRQFQEGLAYFEAGRDDLALSCFNASLHTNPRWSEALIARARVHGRRGDFRLAFADYDVADQVAPSPRIDACEGYCLSELAQDQQAAAFYRRALAAGYDSPAVLNNLGYSWLRLGRLDDAEACLRRALAADATCQAAQHNFVVVFLQRAMQGKAVPPEAFMHARRAAEIGPESGELCRNLAFFYALAAKQDAAWTHTTIACVAKAVAHGINPETFKTDLVFATLQKDPAFHEALVVRGGSQAAVKAVRLIDPAAEPQ